MIAVDTSVVVAAFASWHEAHDSAADVLRREPRLVGHVALEAYSVLTRLPPPHRAPASLVSSFLEQRFREPPLVLSAAHYGRLLTNMPKLGLTGGAVYDALVATTAREAGAMLWTRDLRAVRTYEAVGASYTIVS